MSLRSTRKKIEILNSPGSYGLGSPKPWLVFIGGEVWRDARGVGRRFATKEKAEEALRKHFQ